VAHRQALEPFEVIADVPGDVTVLADYVVGGFGDDQGNLAGIFDWRIPIIKLLSGGPVMVCAR